MSDGKKAGTRSCFFPRPTFSGIPLVLLRTAATIMLETIGYGRILNGFYAPRLRRISVFDEPMRVRFLMRSIIKIINSGKGRKKRDTILGDETIIYIIDIYIILSSKRDIDILY